MAQVASHGMIRALYHLFLIATTLVIHLSLHGNRWVHYQEGHSGLWAHCNTSKSNESGQPKDPNKEEEVHCSSIRMHEASGVLHVIRAALITACVCWWFGIIIRFSKCNTLGLEGDRPVIHLPFITSVLELIGFLMFTLGHYQTEYLDNPDKYIEAYLMTHYYLSFFAATMAACSGTLAVWMHIVANPESSWNFPRRCRLRFKSCGPLVCNCFGQRTTAPSSSTAQTPPCYGISSAGRRRGRSAVAQQPSTIEIAVVSSAIPGDSSSRPERQRTSSPSAGAAGDRGPGFSGAGRRKNEDSGTAATTTPALSTSAASYSNAARRHANGSAMSTSILSPNVITLPPAYEDVIRDDEMRFGVCLSPPPLYEELDTNSKLLLSNKLAPKKAY